MIYTKHYNTKEYKEYLKIKDNLTYKIINTMKKSKYNIGDKIFTLYGEVVYEMRVWGIMSRIGGKFFYAVGTEPFPKEPINAIWKHEESIFTSKEE